MSHHVNYLPKIVYETELCVDIMRRFILVDNLLKKKVIMYEYTVKPGERPDTIASKYYGSDKWDWLVMFANRVDDRYYDWPLDYEEFERYLIKKYGSVANAHQTIHSYWRIVYPREQLYDGTIIDEKLMRIDITEYATLINDEKFTKSCYQYETDLNESRRNINIIDKAYLQQINTELRAYG